MVDLSHGRGWLNPGPAASIHRIDRVLGHPLQITEAGRSWAQQNVHYRRYLRNGYPIALSPDAPSVHQLGAAIDSDEAQKHLALMTEHGWVRTVWRNGRLVEPWHFEYQAHRDQHRFDAEPASTTPTIPEVDEEDEDDMAKYVMHHHDHPNYKYEVSISGPGGFYLSYVTNDPETNNAFAEQYETGSSIKVSDSMFRVIQQANAQIRPQTSITVEVANADA